MIKKKIHSEIFLPWMASKKIIIEITTYCDEKKGMFDKNKKGLKCFLKKDWKYPQFFFCQKYWPKPQKTKQELKGIRWDIITH